MIEQINALEQEQSTDLKTLASLKHFLEGLERELAALLAQLESAQGEIDDKAARYAGLEKEAECSRSLSEQRLRHLAVQIRHASRQSLRHSGRWLFSSQAQPDRYFQSTITAYLNHLLQEQMTLLSSLESQQQVVVQERESLEQARRGLQVKQQELERQKTARAEKIKSLDGFIAKRGLQLSSLQEDLRRLEALVESIQQEHLEQERLAKPPQDFSALKSRLKWPVKGRLRKLFGTKRQGKLNWDGVVIGADEGQNVEAIHDGRVAYADWLPGMGMLMIIDHGKGYLSMYGHNQRLLKEEGDWVESREVIARVGNSGGRLNPGLYFAIRHKGRPRNPKRWCK